MRVGLESTQADRAEVHPQKPVTHMETAPKPHLVPQPKLVHRIPCRIPWLRRIRRLIRWLRRIRRRIRWLRRIRRPHPMAAPHPAPHPTAAPHPAPHPQKPASQSRRSRGESLLRCEGASIPAARRRCRTRLWRRSPRPARSRRHRLGALTFHSPVAAARHNGYTASLFQGGAWERSS